MSDMVITSSYNNLVVNIELDKGIYVFGGCSGTGKTFLAKILHSVCSIKKIKYKYFNNVMKDYKADTIVSIASGNDLVFFDNADLYLTSDILKDIKDTRCILISMKDVCKLGVDYRDCDVVYDGKSVSLEVYK